MLWFVHLAKWRQQWGLYVRKLKEQSIQAFESIQYTHNLALHDDTDAMHILHI